MTPPPAFFTAQEIHFLADWADDIYDKNNPTHVAAKDYIMNSLGTKTQYWSNELVKRLPEFETYNARIWSQKGWVGSPGGKRQVSRFKSYTWARLFKASDKGKDIFFTVGVDGPKNALIYKLDYFSKNESNLDTTQKEIVDKNIPSRLKWKYVDASNLASYNWDRLLQETGFFVAKNADVYDRLIQLAWGGAPLEEVFVNVLRESEKPKSGYSAIPPIASSFSGTDKDFLQESIDHKEIGDAGENLVIQHEKGYLKSLGKNDLADRVKKVSNGKGYDIHSFMPDETPKFIEVKTTRGGSSTSFYYTLNEQRFAEQNPENYVIYRLYNYDDESNSADFYVMKNPSVELLSQPVVFRMYPKKPEV